MKDRVSVFILLVVLCVDALYSAEIAFLLSIFYLLVRGFFYKGFLKDVECVFKFWWGYLFLLVFSLLYGLAVNDFYLVVKDAWYFIKPVVFFLIGFSLLGVSNERFVIVTISFCLLLLSMIHSFPIIISGDFFTLSVDDLRDVYGQGSLGAVFVCFLFYYCRVRGFLSKRLCLFFILLSFVLLFFTFSRMLLLFLLIGLVHMSFLHRYFNKRTYLVGILFLIMLNIPAEVSNQTIERNNVIAKFTSTLEEIRPSNYFLDSDIHQRWRGYETYKAIEAYGELSFVEKVFGGGLGMIVPIDFAKRSRWGDDKYYHLEWLHNAYMTILLKMGGLGLIVVLSINLIMSNFFSKNSKINSKIGMFSLTVLVVSTYVAGGILNKSDVLIILLFLGYFSAFSYRVIENESVDGSSGS
jgi:hypothetical protein